MNFSIDTSVKGTQQTVETSIGTINAGDTVIIFTPQGNRTALVTEISSRWIKTSYQSLKFSINHLGWIDMGPYATIKIVAVVQDIGPACGWQPDAITLDAMLHDDCPG